MRTKVNVLVRILYLLELLSNLIRLHKLRKSRKRKLLKRWWVKPHLQSYLRDTVGGYQLIFKYFKLNNEEEFYGLIGLPIRYFNHLLTLIQERLQKFSIRKPLIPELKLAVVLSFLHHGGNPKYFALFYRIGNSTMYNLIKEICTVISEIILPLYIIQPTRENWLIISKQYEDLWNLPHCLGALDGKHFNIKKPPNSGSAFFNYKNHFSVVLLATCDAFRRFTWFNLGDFGSVNDASIFNNSDLHQRIVNEDLQIPPSRNLPGSNIQMPYFFIGDNIFALQKHLMIPYNRVILNYNEKVYNYRIKRARLSIENAFGLLTSKWAIFQKSHAFNLNTMQSIIICTIALHNMIISLNLQENNYNIPELEDEFEEEEIVHANLNAINQRDLLADYFVSEEGLLEWQAEYI